MSLKACVSSVCVSLCVSFDCTCRVLAVVSTQCSSYLHSFHWNHAQTHSNERQFIKSYQHSPHKCLFKISSCLFLLLSALNNNGQTLTGCLCFPTLSKNELRQVDKRDEGGEVVTRWTSQSKREMGEIKWETHNALPDWNWTKERILLKIHADVEKMVISIRKAQLITSQLDWTKCWVQEQLSGHRKTISRGVDQCSCYCSFCFV